MTYARSSAVPKDCNIGRIATPLPEHGITRRKMHARARTQWVSATCGCQELSQSVQGLSLFVWRSLLLSQRVSLIKTGLHAKSNASASLRRRRALIFIILSHRRAPAP